MKKAHRQRIQDFIQHVLPLLEMADWRIKLSDEQPPDDCYAVVRPVEGQKIAHIEICAEFFDLDDRTRRRVLLHELAHCLSRDATQIMQNALPGLLGQPTFSALWEPYRLAVEVMTDTLAQILCDLIEIEV